MIRSFMFKQVVMTAFGGTEVLADVICKRNALEDGEIRLKVHAAAVNPIDAKIRQGSSFVCKQRLDDPFPWGLGFDVAGEVIESSISEFKTGDRLAASVGTPFHPAAYAEEAVVRKEHCMLLPKELSYEQGAALITAGLTALSIMHSFCHEKKILVSGGSGGVGHLLVQYLQCAGFNVSASCSAASYAFLSRYVKELFDYKDDLAKNCAQTFDAVVDMVGGDVGKSLYPLLKEGGLLVTVPTITEDQLKACCPQNKRCEGVRCLRSPERYKELLSMAKKGCLPYISSRFTLDAAGTRLAHAQIESVHTRGKIVLIP